MVYKKIIQRAEKERRLTDSVVWEGICVRCGLENKIFGDELEKKYKDYRVDVRELDLKCRSPRCGGRVRWRGRIPIKRALHLNDIRRR